MEKRYQNVKNYIAAKKPSEIKAKSKRIPKFKNTLLNEIIKNWNYFLSDSYELSQTKNKDEIQNLENWLAYRNHKLKRIAKYLNAKYCNECNLSNFLKKKDEKYSLNFDKGIAEQAKQCIDEDNKTEEIPEEIIDEILEETDKK